MAAIHAKAFINSIRDLKKFPEPFEVLLPWPNEAAAEEVTPEERAVLKAKLLRHSAFAEQ